MVVNIEMGLDCILITKSRIREYIHNNRLECSGDIYNAINSKVETILNDGISRAKQNNRKRLLVRDL